MIPPAARRWTGGDLLDLPAGLGQLKSTVRFEILNYDLTFVFTAEQVDLENPPTIQFDANADTCRTMSGLRFSARDAARINPLLHLVRPVWVLDDGSEFPMGVFMFADSPLDVHSYGDEFTPSCYDRSVLLNQARGRSYSISPGTLFTTSVRELLAEVGLLSWASIDASSVYATTPQVFPPANTRGATLRSICQALGFYPWYFNNDGFVRFRAVPNPISSAEPDAIYTLDENSRVLFDSIKASSNIVTAPNVYRVVGATSAGGEVVGEFRVPDSAPHSVARRGFEIAAPPINNQAVQDQQAADVAAQAAYANDFDTHVQVEYQTPADPRADGMQLEQFDGVNYRVQSWGMEAAPGGVMVHVVQEVWVP